MLKLNCIDPGLLRTREALKAVVSLTLTILITMQLGKFPALMAGLMVSFMVLCHDGVTRRQQSISMILVWLTILLAIVGGLWLSHWSIAADVVLIAGVFAAFYVQQFGPRYRIFPVMASILFLLMIAIHFPSNLPLDRVLLGCIIGGVVGLVVQLLVGNGASQLQARHHHLNLRGRYNLLVDALTEAVATPRYSVEHILSLIHI